MELNAILGLATLITIGGITVFIYIVSIMKFWVGRYTPFLRSKSITLSLASAIGNLLSIIAILISASSYLFKSKPGVDLRLGFIVSEIIFIPIMFIGTMLRGEQLYKIINVNFDTGDDRTKGKWFRTKFYLRILLGLELGFIVLGSYLAYIIANIDHDLNAIMSIIVTFHFVTGMTWSIILIEILAKNSGSSEHFQKELLLLIICWTGFNFAIEIIIFKAKADSVFAIAMIFVTLRNATCFIISFGYPALVCKKIKYLPYGETRKCVTNIDLTLSTKIPFLTYFSFLESAKGENARNLIMLYCQIKLFEETALTTENTVILSNMAMKIQHDFLIDQSEYKVEGILPEVQKSIENKFENFRLYLNKHLFDALYGVVHNILKEYFEEFKTSNLYKNLLSELRINEIVYERMVNSCLI